MNKKFSTLVASLLFATCFGASAQTYVDTEIASGSTFLLGAGGSWAAGNEADNVLTINDKGELALLPKADVKTASKVNRAKALWKVSYTQDAHKAYTFTFVNESTGQTLVLPKSGAATAHVAEGLGEFVWLDTATPGGDEALANGDYKLYTVATLAAEGSTAPDPTTGGIIEVVLGGKETAFAKAIAELNKVTSKTSLTAEEVTAVKAATKVLKDANAGVINSSFNGMIAGLEGVTTTTNVSTSFSGLGTALTALENYTSEFGDVTIDKDGNLGGIIASDKTVAPAGGKNYLKGTKVVTATALAFAPAIVGELELPDATEQVAATTLATEDALLASFVREFKQASDAADGSTVSVKFGFTTPKDKKVQSNPLADKEYQLVYRNLLMQTSGKTYADDVKTDAEKTAAKKLVASYQKVAMLKVKGENEYLTILPATYETGTNDTYFKLVLNKLNAVSDVIGGTGSADQKFYAPATDFAGSYSFTMDYTVENDSVSIKPAFVFDKGADGKTTIAANTNQVVSFKDFSNIVEMTVIAADKATDNTLDIDPWKISTNGMGGTPDAVVTTIESGIYVIECVSGVKNGDNGKIYGAKTDQSNAWMADAENVWSKLPFAQWVAKKDADGRVTIWNRETKVNLTGSDKAIQLYKAGDNVFAYGVVSGDTLKMTKIADGGERLGYFDAPLYKKYQLTYFNELDATKKVNVNKDGVLFVDTKGEALDFIPELVKILDKDTTVVESGSKDIATNLKMVAYRLTTTVKGVKMYVGEKNGSYVLTATDTDAKSFWLRETMHRGDDKTPFYVLYTTSDDKKVSVNDNDLHLYQEAAGTENRTSMFALTGEPAPLYRRLGATIEDAIAKNDTAYVEFFKADEATRFLYENSSNIVANNGTEFAKDSLNFLGMYNKADMKRNASIFVDTAYVRNETYKPLYMLALGVQFTEGTDSVPCPIHGYAEDCPHWTAGTPSYTEGRYLVTLTDSVAAGNTSAMYQGNDRLAFVPAKHIADTLIINNSIYTTDKHNLDKDSLLMEGENKMNAATFAFRLVDDSNAADFYIEAEPKKVDDEMKAQYVRIHNGIPVLVTELSEAAIFNVNPTEETPTANEDINASSVSVIAGNGVVTINGAAGKKVVITNVLGQTIANTVLSSDNATISAPVGVVVVAVEGEAAVKAIVK
ncbi:DUF6383 domain-containing protein [Parabacteroides gordonii]|uniref:DUF6383 domain-containing protein n=1 Tax=Parabacteroides gordonii MS-1 = DSM 23371 TaxID=1203610 RepID=A0A0F5JKR7_9BACT|nr:DUF6383 domain-containing protein [Parabacteroides gordonii]KKB58383.1 hypothetical protein HMPREF1536_01259 [Parabacteroides gordonii MS-1 = DSM 23371]MCA5583350.1 DUF6383 domain-containing protein [Parabacteroides gordonii]